MSFKAHSLIVSSVEKCLSDNNNNSDADSLYYEVQETFPYAQCERPLVAANCSEYAVAHSNVNLQPARRMHEVSFLPHILDTMRRLRLTQLLRLQSYAWPHLGQGIEHGAVIVSAPRSGKTLSYVPPLCQVVFNELKQQRCGKKRWNLNGPIALVIAADLTRVQQIGALCNSMLRKAKNEEWLTLVLTVPSAHSIELFQRLLNGVGCLLATPAQFLWLCENSIQLPSLKFIVYDDVHLMDMEKLLQVHKELVSVVKQQSPQLVITTQSYKTQFLHMLQELNAHPLLLFGDILEAAVYGGTRMRISLLKKETKHQELLSVLQQRPPHLFRTVINCQTDADIRDIVEVLEAQGYRCLPYYQTSDLTVREHVHRWMQKTLGELLLCTDDCPELEVRHARTLLHYSMSDSWSKFKLRHLMLADNLNNRFKANQLEEQSEKQECVVEQDSLLSLVFLDESNNNQLPRLVDFLKMHQPVDERVVQLARQIRDQLERAKCHEPALCDLLLSLGDCKDTQCEQRHQLLPLDQQLPDHIPASGDVKVQLIRVYSPVHYCVLLLEHLAPGGNWKPIPRPATLELQLQLLQSEERVRYWPPVAKEICVYRNPNGYERVRVLRVAPIPHLNISRTDIAVEVKALDVDTRQFKTTSGKLYVCPEQLRDKPPLAIDVRILGMVPFTGERNWHDNDGGQCAKWLNAVPQPNFLQANIVVALTHTLFVQDLAVTSYAPSLKMHVRSLTMCALLRKQQLAKKCEQTIDRLMQFLEKEQRSQDVIQQEMPAIMKQAMSVKLGTMTQLPSKLGFFAEMAKQMGKENRLRQEQLEREKQLQEELLNPKPSVPKPVDSFEALYNCFMKCTLMELTEKEQAQSDVPLTLLSHIMPPEEKPEPEPKPLPKLIKKATGGTAAAIIERALDTQCRIPDNIRRPEVIYYQTLCTLELHIILPEDGMLYEAELHNSYCIAFWTIETTPSAPIYQFMLNTHCAYQQLCHHMQGRTVYLSAVKASAVPYPLDFGFYKFMKAHHEKLHQLDEERRSRIADYEAHLLRMGYIEDRKMSFDYSSDELSCDEHVDEQPQDPRLERIERARELTNEFHFDVFT